MIPDAILTSYEKALRDGDVYQLLPWDFRGWHCGGGANNTHIGVEMTEPATIRYTGGSNWTETGDGKNTKNHVLAAYKCAVELFAYLCGQFGLDPMADGVIISHSEGCKRGIASNHGAVEHLWSKFGLSMQQVRKDIKAAMEGSTAEDSLTAIMGKAAATAEQMKSYLKKKNPSVPQIQHLKACASTDKLRNERIDPRFRYVTRGCAPYVEWLGQKENPQGKGWAAGEKYGEKILSILKAIVSEGKVQFVESLTLSAPYMVRVSIPDLNIRRGPGKSYPKTGKFTGVGVFTVVEEKDGWGLLKAYQEGRDGWISLAFTTRM